jgi:hypothetical protein
MLSFLARCGKAAVDLTVSNPSLAWALASNSVFHRPSVQRPLRSARRLLSKKQRHILSWLGFPETEAARRILAKVVHDTISIPALFYVRQAMADPAMFRAMSHLPRLNAGVIRIVTDPMLLPFAAPTLLDEIAHSHDEDQVVWAAYWLRDSLTMLSQLFPNGKKLQPVRSVYRLHNLHETLMEEINRVRCLEIKAPSPPPPVEGTDAIVPITNAMDLLEEGNIMHNCVASYGENVAIQQRVYIYRVLCPERCTLSLRWHGGSWILSELKRARNELASEETHLVVRKWLGCKNEAVSRMPFVLEPIEIPF